jgi:hypothetical protein
MTPFPTSLPAWRCRAFALVALLCLTALPAIAAAAHAHASTDHHDCAVCKVTHSTAVIERATSLVGVEPERGEAAARTRALFVTELAFEQTPRAPPAS